ncbi:MAG TPA: hypothetical protein VKE24_16260 [Candidatus Acidoferrales bacterium]|nr:hypothetical protein [Candidatus Acidoferrales bacterium]
MNWARILLLLVLGVALLASNRWFTFIDDEVWILDAAAKPLAETIRAYTSGSGEHEHPPLFDLLLHGWLKLTGGPLALLRLPSIAFYVLGLCLLVRAAADWGGEAGAKAMLWIGVFWPYGFHFGRLAAWYSLAFLLVGLVTLAYIRFCASPTLARTAVLFAASLALVYTNYFGWALLACLLLDFARAHRSDFVRFRWRLVAGASLLVGAYAPLWPALLATSSQRLRRPWSLLGAVLYAGQAGYAALVSESVAPWFWWLSAPACVAVALCVLLTVLRAPTPARRFLFYFFFLFVALAALGLLTTKRLMLIAPWLLLAIALTATARRGPVRRMVAAALVLIFVIGWFGIVTRRFYAAPRFIEPWQEVAEQAAEVVHEGGITISNHPSFFLYLTYALRGSEQVPRRGFAGILGSSVEHPQVFDADRWVETRRPVRAMVFLAKGVPAGSPNGPLQEAEHWLDARCNLHSDRRLLRDPGYELKQRFFPELGQMPWRILVREYTCADAR